MISRTEALVPIDGTLICRSNFQHQETEKPIWDSLKLGKIKKEKAELEKKMKRTTPQSWKIESNKREGWD